MWVQCWYSGYVCVYYVMSTWNNKCIWTADWSYFSVSNDEFFRLFSHSCLSNTHKYKFHLHWNCYSQLICKCGDHVIITKYYEVKCYKNIIISHIMQKCRTMLKFKPIKENYCYNKLLLFSNNHFLQILAQTFNVW